MPIFSHRQFVLISIVLFIACLISWQVIGPLINNDLVVQDDFRQSCFWFWTWWDPELFKNDFFTPLYQSLMVRAPLLLATYKLVPLVTDNLIWFSKLFALLITLATGITGFLFFNSLLNKYSSFDAKFGESSLAKITIKNTELLSIIFAEVLVVTTWCTDHITVTHSRSFVWLFILLYMYLKLIDKDLLANLSSLISLFISPHAFLITFTMEFFSQILRHKRKIFDYTRKDLWFFSFNALVTAFLYLVIFKDLHTQGVGTPFTVKEMKALPEFNPGGRHPIFGSSIADGTWWTNEHWGLGIGYLKISDIIVWSFWSLMVYLIFYWYEQKKKKPENFYNSFVLVLNSTPATLLYASIVLYFVSQIMFPTLYLPSRYLAVPSLLLSLILLVLLVAIWSWQLTSRLPKSFIKNLFALVLLVSACLYWAHFKNFYHTRYVSINAEINKLLSSLPKNSLIAGHPLLPDLNVASITSKRSVFVDYERSMAYTKESLAEIRRRNEVALRMVYAKDREEFMQLARDNGITHFLAHYAFYQPDYLNNPVYMKPYDVLLRNLINSNDKYFLQTLMEKQGTTYLLVDVNRVLSDS